MRYLMDSHRAELREALTSYQNDPATLCRLLAAAEQVLEATRVWGES